MVLRRFLLLFLLTSPAVANTIIVVGTDNNLGETIFLRENGSNESAYAGGIDVKVDGYTRVLFCVDLLVNINTGTYNTALDFADTPQPQTRCLTPEQLLPHQRRHRRRPAARDLGHHER
jgi:hypothetical protein